MPGGVDAEMQLLTETRAELAKADNKASLVLAALGIGFGSLLGGVLAGDWAPSELKGIAEPIWWIGAGCAIASVVSAAASVWPRRAKTSAADTINYWADVATFKTPTEFTSHLDKNPIHDRNRTRHQLWVLSGIVSIKYKLVQAAFVLAGLGVALFGIAALPAFG